MTRGDLLGWDPFRALLAGCAATPLGRDGALALAPSTSLAEVRAALADTREARRALEAEGPPPWAGLTDVRPTLDQAVPDGAVLDGPALAELGRALVAAERLQAYASRIAAVAPTVAARWRGLPSARALAGVLTRALDPDGGLTDEASPRLRALRRQLLALRAQVETRLERLLDGAALATALQDRYVTARNGRYVVPIRAEAQRSVRGIVHDRSQSGATVFVEPEAVVPLNNELTQKSLEARDEELRILAELTDRVRAERSALEPLVEGLAALDLVFARAALAERLGATEPLVEAGGDLELRAARHPLLVAQEWDAERTPAAARRPGGVVPIDLRIPADRPGLVVSGPNAGGKTVALETCGLLVLMAQAGCHLPVEPGSRVPLCAEVLAVIGDDQSLAQNLSTFSSFVRQMAGILEGAGPGSLVLLDELGAGTDPAEGAALGAALLEALLDRGARVVATTHLEPLKVFAQTEPRLTNATVAFDREQLRPTFRLEYGHPGPSYALAIGERFGLPPAVIARARTHLSETSRRLDALLADLARRERAAEALIAQATRREAEAAAALAAAREAALRAETEAGRVRRDAETEARALLADTRRRVGHELDRLKADAGSRRVAREAYHRLRAAEGAVPASPAAPGAGAGAPPEPGGAPVEVQLRGLGLRGRVVAEDEDTVTVRAGQLTVRVARAQLETAPGPPGPVRAAAVSVPSKEDAPRELHVRGLTTDEARAAVEKFLDDALLAGHGVVRVVHGKGTGALKRAIDACLRAHPTVSAFRTAPAAEGGGGATLVELHGQDQPVARAAR